MLRPAQYLVLDKSVRFSVSVKSGLTSSLNPIHHLDIMFGFAEGEENVFQSGSSFVRVKVRIQCSYFWKVPFGLSNRDRTCSKLCLWINYKLGFVSSLFFLFSSDFSWENSAALYPPVFAALQSHNGPDGTNRFYNNSIAIKMSVCTFLVFVITVFPFIA